MLEENQEKQPNVLVCFMKTKARKTKTGGKLGVINSVLLPLIFVNFLYVSCMASI